MLARNADIDLCGQCLADLAKTSYWIHKVEELVAVVVLVVVVVVVVVVVLVVVVIVVVVVVLGSNYVVSR